MYNEILFRPIVISGATFCQAKQYKDTVNKTIFVCNTNRIYHMHSDDNDKPSGRQLQQ